MRIRQKSQKRDLINKLQEMDRFNFMAKEIES